MNSGARREVVDSAQLHLFPHLSPLLTFHSPHFHPPSPTARLTTRGGEISLQASLHPRKVAPLEPQLPRFVFCPIIRTALTCEYEAECAVSRQGLPEQGLHRTCLWLMSPPLSGYGVVVEFHLCKSYSRAARLIPQRRWWKSRLNLEMRQLEHLAQRWK